MPRRGSLQILLLLGLTVFFGGILFYGFYSQPKGALNTTPPPTPPSSPQSTATSIATSSIDTSNWKTYRNEKYHYEFKYPENVGVVSEYDSSFLGAPTDPNEKLLLISDREKTFHFQINESRIIVVKDSKLAQKILSTFKFTK